MNSLWQEAAKAPDFKELREDIKTDVLIIGGGLAGLVTAYVLKLSGVDAVVLEADEICSGITKNTTAKISSQHGLIYAELIKKFGIEKAQMYLEANEKAIDVYRKLAEKTDCDFQEKSSFVYSLCDCRKIEKEMRALEKIKFSARFCDKLSLPFSVAGAVEFPNQAEFHPLKFAYSIAKELKIYENTKVCELKENTAITKKGKVRAEKIIVATHFPFINKHGLYFLKMHQHRSYVIALKYAEDVRGMYIDENEKGLSFRNYKDYLLLGGGSHRTGETGGNFDELSQFAKRHYPGASEAFRFATQDCMTLDGIPYIGRYSRFSQGLYVATGFNKWGMTSSMVSGMILSDMMLGKKNSYEEVFSPSRSMLRPKLAVNIGKTLINFVTPTAPRCPHLGCALKYNRAEHSWDCPCHGSRFTEDKKLIDNPATSDIKTRN